TSVATMLPRICGLFLYTAALSFPLSDLVVGVGWLDGFAAGGSSSDRKSARPIRGPADWLCRGLVCRRRGLFHLRHWPHDWLWRYRAAAGARARTCDRDWCLRALPHGPHSGDCGLRHAHSAHRSRHRLTHGPATRAMLSFFVDRREGAGAIDLFLPIA